MTYVDAALVNATEAFCHWFQRLTGRTNVWLAFQLTNLSIIIYFVWAGVQFLASETVPRLVLAVFCAGLLYLLAQSIFRVPVESYELSAYQRVAKGVPNPRRIRDLMLRVPFLTLSVLLLYPAVVIYDRMGLHLVALVYALVVLTTIVLYLLACDPLPPRAGRVKAWFRARSFIRLQRTDAPAQ